MNYHPLTSTLYISLTVKNGSVTEGMDVTLPLPLAQEGPSTLRSEKVCLSETHTQQQAGRVQVAIAIDCSVFFFFI